MVLSREAGRSRTGRADATRPFCLVQKLLPNSRFPNWKPPICARLGFSHNRDHVFFPLFFFLARTRSGH